MRLCVQRPVIKCAATLTVSISDQQSRFSGIQEAEGWSATLFLYLIPRGGSNQAVKSFNMFPPRAASDPLSEQTRAL